VPWIPTENHVSDYVEPLGKRVLVRKDESRQKTKGGIVLPDDAEIPTITGRVVEISAQVEHDNDFPIRKYDKILFNPKRAIPVDFESDNLLYVVPLEDVVAVFRRAPAAPSSVASSEDESFGDDDELE
jgi:chaperonin GroES